MKRQAKIVGEVCLYGGHHAAGYLAQSSDGKMFGDGDPRKGRSLNDAFWLGAMDLRDKAGCDGDIWVYRPDGKAKARVNIHHLPYYGGLTWEQAEMYVISAEEIERVAAEQGGVS